MSSDSTSKIQVSEVELTPKRVEGNKKEIRDTWWEYNVSEQFPIKSVKETNDMADIEVDKLIKANAKRVSLGKRILRTETAPIVMISDIIYEFEL